MIAVSSHSYLQLSRLLARSTRQVYVFLHFSVLYKFVFFCCDVLGAYFYVQNNFSSRYVEQFWIVFTGACRVTPNYFVFTFFSSVRGLSTLLSLAPEIFFLFYGHSSLWWNHFYTLIFVVGLSVYIIACQIIHRFFQVSLSLSFSLWTLVVVSYQVITNKSKSHLKTLSAFVSLDCCSILG